MTKGWCNPYEVGGSDWSENAAFLLTQALLTTTDGGHVWSPRFPTIIENGNGIYVTRFPLLDHDICQGHPRIQLWNRTLQSSRPRVGSTEIYQYDYSPSSTPDLPPEKLRMRHWNPPKVLSI